MDRETVVWNCSCVNALKGTVLHRTVPRDRVNGKPIRTYAERFHTEPFQSPRANAALKYSLYFAVCHVKKGQITLIQFTKFLRFSTFSKFGKIFHVSKINKFL